jgi:glyoxylase-like metal-dependent hydrolase (beta-lactamase superfamily II)
MNYKRTYLLDWYLEREPFVEPLIVNVGDGDFLQIDDSKVTIIETPGHYWDHICFLLEEPGAENVLFTGDHILGSQTVLIIR